jgi:hypothetical protein
LAQKQALISFGLLEEKKKHKRWNYNGGTDNTKKFPK